MRNDRLISPRTAKETIKNSPKETRHPLEKGENPSLNTLSVTMMIKIIGKRENAVVNISIGTMCVLKIVSNPIAEIIPMI